MILQASDTCLPQMPPLRLGTPERVLMTIDAVGGVWRYAMVLAAQLGQRGVGVVFAGLGPKPDRAQVAEARAIGELVWLDAPLDWTVQDEHELQRIPRLLAEAVAAHDIDLVHLNLPSLACGLDVPVPVVVVTHSCIVTWFRAVRSGDAPAEWQWHLRRNRRGFDAADTVVAPSRSHAALTAACYGALPELRVVHNASAPQDGSARKSLVALAAGRWWDDGKNGSVLDTAAGLARTPVEMAGPLAAPGGQAARLRHARHLGEVGHGDLRRLMGQRAIFVSPSVYEPFGLAALEAAHSGSALVLSDIPTYRELWDDAAVFVRPDDACGLAAAIDALAEDTARREGFAEAARLRALRYAPATQAKAMLQVYRDAILRRVEPTRLAS